MEKIVVFLNPAEFPTFYLKSLLTEDTRSKIDSLICKLSTELEEELQYIYPNKVIDILKQKPNKKQKVAFIKENVTLMKANLKNNGFRLEKV